MRNHISKVFARVHQPLIDGVVWRLMSTGAECMPEPAHSSAIWTGFALELMLATP